jgi:Ca2+/H+ antiporter, TMEM165/GDT1 family
VTKVEPKKEEPKAQEKKK